MESKPLLDVVTVRDDSDDGSIDHAHVAPSRAIRRRTKCVAFACVTLLLSAFVFLMAHDAVRSESLGRTNSVAWFKTMLSGAPSTDVEAGGDGNASTAQGKGAALGQSRVLTPTKALTRQMVLVEETRNVPMKDRSVVEVTRSYDGRRVRVPTFLEKWATAPFWEDNAYLNVHESPNSETGKLFVSGHSTDMGKYANVWLASATHWGLPARITGHGTTWNNWEDKTMGLRTDLEHMSGNPVVVVSDTGDVFFSCGQDELLKRFEDSGADMLVSGETQLYPEVMSYYEFRDDIDWMDKHNNMGEIGRVAEGEPFRGGIPGDPRAFRWPNAGLMMGRKDALLKYFDYLEDSFVETENLSGERRFRSTCKAFQHTDAQAKEERMNDGFYDDQLCLASYAMSRIADRDPKFKIDLDGSILHSPGAMDMRLMRRDEKTGRVYNAETGKSPCAWHFNTANAKTHLSMAVEKFPNYFVSENVGNEILGREFEPALGAVPTPPPKSKKKSSKKSKKRSHVVVVAAAADAPFAVDLNLM